MTAVIISVCALVLAAATTVVLALLISRASLHQRLLEALGDRCSNISKDIEKTSNATLRAELVDLRGAVEVLAASNRKELGRLWSKLAPPKTNGAAAANDEQFEAMVALQRAPDPPQP